MAVAYFRSDTLTGTRTPLCWTQLQLRSRDNGGLVLSGAPKPTAAGCTHVKLRQLLALRAGPTCSPVGNSPSARRRAPPDLGVKGRKFKSRHGRAREAVEFYVSIVKDGRLDSIETYDEEAEGTVKYSGFSLAGREFMAVNSGREDYFAFTRRCRCSWTATLETSTTR